MTAELDVLSIGEALIDFVATRQAERLEDVTTFRRSPGGAPANLAVGVARLGRRAGFLGKVGQDAFGRLLKETLDRNGVDTSRLTRDPERRTGLAFVSLGPGGERSFEFFRHPAADLFLSPEEVDPAYVATARAVHCGSLSLAAQPCRDAVEKALTAARAAGRHVSFDVNLRPALWPQAGEAGERILGTIPLSTILKVSEEEAEFLQPGSTTESFAAWALEQGPQLVAVTLGAGGCYLATRGAAVRVPGFSVSAVDTTGAGDGFLAGLLTMVLDSFPETKTELYGAGRFANAVGALVVTRRGAIPALPTLRRVNAFLAAQAKGTGLS